jgi:CheY-like chemotaxis protein
MNDLSGFELLLVEDNPADARLIVEVFDGFHIRNNITLVSDGAEAMDYLHKKGNYKDRKCPSLIVLDLNLTKKDGRKILKEVKNDEKLMRVPVIVLTTSSSEDDVMAAYGHHANAYLTKPGDFDEFVELVKTFEDFWFKWATLPKCTE